MATGGCSRCSCNAVTCCIKPAEVGREYRPYVERMKCVIPLYRTEFVYDFYPHLLANEPELIVSSSFLQEMTLRSSSLQ